MVLAVWKYRQSELVVNLVSILTVRREKNVASIQTEKKAVLFKNNTRLKLSINEKEF